MKFENMPAHLITLSGNLARLMWRNMCSVAHMVAKTGDRLLPPLPNTQLWGGGGSKKRSLSW